MGLLLLTFPVSSVAQADFPSEGFYQARSLSTDASAPTWFLRVLPEGRYEWGIASDAKDPRATECSGEWSDEGSQVVGSAWCSVAQTYVSHVFEWIPGRGKRQALRVSVQSTFGEFSDGDVFELTRL